MRDPTRGGLASTLNEIAQSSSVGIAIDEASLPVRTEVQSACELLGLDPVYVANEGKAVFFVAPEAADSVLEILRAHPLGSNAARIGQVTASTSACWSPAPPWAPIASSPLKLASSCPASASPPSPHCRPLTSSASTCRIVHRVISALFVHFQVTSKYLAN